MSRMTAAWAAMSLITASVQGLKSGEVGGDDPDWTYANHGEDWTGDCAIDTNVQSPISFSNDSSVPLDWGYFFSFLTVWSVPESIAKEDHGIVDYVYQI